MNAELLKETIKRELPGLLRDDPALRDYILELTRGEFAGRTETQGWFREMMDELRRDREGRAREMDELRRDREERAREWAQYIEDQNRKWEAQERNWEAQERNWETQERKWETQERKWESQERKWDEEVRRWEEQDRRWAEQAVKWDEQASQWAVHQQELRNEFKRIHEEIMAQARKHERGIGALGARWGLQSERAFRDALAGILEESFGVQVLNVSEYDDRGEVFGRPDQVELDVIVKNGLLLICELKSSIDKAGMYIFERKARFYERQHQRKANRLIVISPMIDARARQVAQRLGIETYSDSTDVESL